MNERRRFAKGVKMAGPELAPPLLFRMGSSLRESLGLVDGEIFWKNVMSEARVRRREVGKRGDHKRNNVKRKQSQSRQCKDIEGNTGKRYADLYCIGWMR